MFQLSPQDYAACVARREQEESQAADRLAAKRKAADDAYSAALSSWRSRVDGIFSEGTSLFGSDENILHQISDVMSQREEAREKKAQEQVLATRTYYATLSNFGAMKDVVRSFVFTLPVGVLLAIILEYLGVPSLIAVVISAIAFLCFCVSYFRWIKSEGKRIRDEDDTIKLPGTSIR